LPKPSSGADLEAFGLPLDYPYLLGAYLAVNAVRGAAILVDGPDCALGKAEHVLLHDFGSDLLDCAGASRVECTWTDARNAAISREEAVSGALLSLARRRDVRAALLSALPLASVTGADYDGLLRRLSRRAGKPLLWVPPRSLQAGYLEGYDAVLTSLAAGLDFQGNGEPRAVAVVAPFMDRSEEDRRADVREIERMLRGIGLDPLVWPGRALDSGKAGVVLSMPYGRGAARTLADRLKVRRVDAGLPVGLAGTARWLRETGRGFGLEANAERFIERESARVSALLARSGRLLRGKRVFAAADPHLLGVLVPALREFGLRVQGSAAAGSGRKAPGRLVRPTSGRLAAGLGRGPDLVIGNSDVCRLAPGRPCLELGFPSRRWHALSASPLLGFEGCLSLADRVAGALLRAQRSI